jgi:O-antigen/teichoic acid export membrane protein
MEPKPPAVAESQGRDAGDPEPSGGGGGRSFVRDVLTTGLGQIAAALGMVILYRLLAARVGTTGFASYALVRQAAWLAFPVVMVGLAGGLPRAIGVGSRRPETYLCAAVLISAAATAAITAVMLFLPGPTAALAFGDARRSSLVGPFAATLAATTAYTIAYGYFRGRLRIRRALMLQVGALGIAPVAVIVALGTSSVIDLIDLIAVVLGGLSGAAVVGPLVRGFRWATRSSAAGALRELWNYGYRRVPGELAQIALIVTAPVAVAHVDSVASVAYLAAGQQLLVLLGFLTLPLGIVVLPTLARLWADDRPRGRRFGADLAVLGLHAALFITGQAYAFGPLVVRIWLGDPFAAAEPVIRVTALGTGAYVCYLCIRSALDAVAVKSYNSRNNVIALATSVATAAVLLELASTRPVLAVAWGLTAGLIVQGGLAFLTAREIFAITPDRLHLALASSLGIATAGVALTVRSDIAASAGGLIAIGALELGLFSVYLVGLLRGGAAWPRALLRRPRPVPTRRDEL